MGTRDQEVTWRNTLATSRGSPEWNAMYSLVTAAYEKTKEHMVTADPEQVLVMQGQARAQREIIKYLTGSPIVTQEV